MAYRNISAEVSNETVEQAVEGIDGLKQLLPFIINLTAKEKMRIPIMGDKSIPFVDKAYEVAIRNPELFPDVLDVEELSRDLALTKQLKRILDVLKPFTEMVSDTYYAAGSEAFGAALAVYQIAKVGVKLGKPGCDSIVAELSKRFV